jgi:AraC family transcriptional regulator
MTEVPAINLSKTIGRFPFVSMGSVSQGWNGLEAFTYRLSVPDTFIKSSPIIFWEHATLVMQLDGQPNRLEVHNGRQWTKHLSKPGSIQFSPMNTQKSMRWSESANNIAMSIHRTLLNRIAQEHFQGDPATVAIGSLAALHDPFLTQCGFILAQLLQYNDASDRLYAESLSITMAHHLMRFYADRQSILHTSPSADSQELRRVLDYLHSRYSTPISLFELANHAGMSVAHLSRLFRQKFGVSPHQYLIQLRCQNACKMLQNSTLTIAEVAQHVGFFDQSHFTRHFKRLYRQTPQNWRAKARE